MKDKAQAISKQHPDKTPRELMADIAAAWNNISEDEKAKYNKLAEEDKARYAQEKSEESNGSD